MDFSYDIVTWTYGTREKAVKMGPADHVEITRFLLEKVVTSTPFQVGDSLLAIVPDPAWGEGKKLSMVVAHHSGQGVPVYVIVSANEDQTVSFVRPGA